MSRSRRDPAALRFRLRCFYYARILEVSLAPFARQLPNCYSTPKASHNSLKSALDVSTNTPAYHGLRCTRSTPPRVRPAALRHPGHAAPVRE